MYIDKLTELSDAQAVTASAASTNVFDLGAEFDVGPGQPLFFVTRVTTAFTASGSATMQVALQTDTVEGFGSATTLLQTPAIGKATLVAGYAPLIVPVPHGAQRYLRAYYTVATGPMTAGNIDAFLTRDVQAWQAYARGWTI